jgi:hypothetical protein
LVGVFGNCWSTVQCVEVSIEHHRCPVDLGLPSLPAGFPGSLHMWKELACYLIVNSRDWTLSHVAFSPIKDCETLTFKLAIGQRQSQMQTWTLSRNQTKLSFCFSNERLFYCKAIRNAHSSIF